MPPPFAVGRVQFSGNLPGPDVQLPMDWAQDPHDSRSWRYELHTLQWLQGESLSTACSIALDWIAANPADSPASDLAWIDMAVARRGPWLAHFAEAGAEAGLLGADDARRLREAAIAHAEWLADDGNYRQDNHGLYEDEALLLLAGGHLADHPRAAAWDAHARERLAANLAATVDLESGLHLEHSPGYHIAVVNLLGRLVGLAPEHAPLLDRMRAAAGWLTTADGKLAQLGDSHEALDPENPCSYPPWLEQADGVHRMPGLAAVRRGSSYLIVTCGHHSSIHKHADDGSFIWFEGEQLVCDTGAYLYDADDPFRRHAISAQAHNTLTVDDHDFSERVRRPYGDGIRGVVRDGDELVITVSHPHLLGVRHLRRFRYRPGRLVIEDELTAEAEHLYTRWVHTPQDAAIEVRDETRAPTVEHARRAGWRSPRFREREPTTVHELRARGTEVSLRMVLECRR